MVCRTPGSSEVSPLRISQDDLDLRDLNQSYVAPTLRLVSVESERDVPCEQAATVVPSYEAWQYLPREAREQKVALASQRRAIARRKQAKRTEKAIFHSAAAAACFAAIIGGVHLIAVSAAPHNLVKVTVAPGDTLWTVASRYTPAGSPTVDTVGYIRSANPILGKQNQLRVGEQIFVPSSRG